MKSVPQDLSRCFRHACTHHGDVRCPCCELDRLRREALQAQCDALRSFNQRVLDGRAQQ